MSLTRRQFGIIVGAALRALPQLRAASRGDAIFERRVYDRAGAVPSASMLQRCGMRLVAHDQQASHVHLTIAFASLAERTRAWDRFNSDSEWCALRERREVRLREMAITGV